MSKARAADWRQLRAAGWSIALPIAALIGGTAGVLANSTPVGLVVGAVISLIGLFVLSMGYTMGDIWGGYWMFPVGLAGANIALIVYAFGGSWLQVLAITGVALLMFNVVAAISRTVESEGGLWQLLGHFFRGLLPGQYPRDL